MEQDFIKKLNGYNPIWMKKNNFVEILFYFLNQTNS